LATRNAILIPHLQNLYALYKKLLKAREKRGAIDFETVETQMIFTDQGKIERIVLVIRNDAHKLIEECMLAANVCAANFLQKHEHAVLYRVHQGPTPEKLDALREFMKEFGLQLTGEDDPQAGDYSKLLKRIKGRPDAGLLQTVMLRSLRQAKYEPENIGHFGLGYEAYTHFTSPIRRYPDLLVHRAIKAVLQGKKYQPSQKWVELGAHCSMTERRADDATRDVEAWLKCFYMRDHLGSEFTGTVSSVTNFGMFVALDNLYVEGLVHISELGKDYFQFDPAKHQLLGERTGQRYRVGDRVQVRVVKVDMENTKIDLCCRKLSVKRFRVWKRNRSRSRSSGRRLQRNRRLRKNPPQKQASKSILKERNTMADLRLIYGFHAVTSRIRQNPDGVVEIYLQAQRQDPRMRELIKLAEANGVRMIPIEAARLDGMAGSRPHQGVAARVDASRRVQHLSDVLDTLTEPPLLLVLDGVQDPHNLGACLRSADAFGYMR